MSETLTFFKDNTMYDNFYIIIQDDDFNLEGYDFDYNKALGILEKWEKISWDFIYDILEIINIYYNTNCGIEDVFNTNMFSDFKPYIFKNKYFLHTYLSILDDNQFDIYSYWIRSSEIIDLIIKRVAIKSDIAETILNIINNFYDKYFELEDIFNMDMVINDTIWINTSVSFWDMNYASLIKNM